MVDIEIIKTEIVHKLKPLNPDKIILFGSYAYGEPHSDSDIDLYVVTSDEFMPETWREKSNIYIKYSKKIREIKNDIPTDLIVHTKAMHKKFKELDSMFSRKIFNKGIVLL